MVGVAAHITAAAVGGPRYDPSLTSAERSSERNGVWMCQTHAKFIDDNPNDYPVATLERWKRQHEDWIYSRVANTENHVRNGVTRVAITDLGRFQQKSEVKLGRNNVIFGYNNSGKTTFCQAIAAFSGGPNYKKFASRFNFCNGSPQNSIIEIGIARNDALTTVRLSQQDLRFRRTTADSRHRLHIEVNGNIAPHWPQSLFNAILLEDVFQKPRLLRSSVRTAIGWLAEQLHTSAQAIWDSLRDEIFLTSEFGFKFRRSGIFKLDVLVPGQTLYLPFEALSLGEQKVSFVDLLLKFIRSDPRSTPWFLILDTGFISILDLETKQKLFDRLSILEDPTIQTIFLCALSMLNRNKAFKRRRRKPRWVFCSREPFWDGS